MRVFVCGRFRLPLDRPILMGIVNVTPDSFSDGGRYDDSARAIAHAQQLIADGADILDIGGESTRPGAAPVDVETELARVLPIVEALKDAPVPISVDTSKPEVMRAALAAGASMINDVNALLAPEAIEIVAQSNAGICVMHRKGMPQTMQDAPRYDDVVGEVRAFLAERVGACEAAGIPRERIAIDPGIGFGKLLEHNLALLHALNELCVDGTAMSIGVSRKAWIGQLTGASVADRDCASAVAACVGFEKGAEIARVHNVRATRAALAIHNALKSGAVATQP